MNSTKTLLAIMLICLSCSEEEVKPDCDKLKGEMEVKSMELFQVNRSNPYNNNATPSKAEVDAWEKLYDKYFFEYTLATKNYHDCKY